MSIQRKKDRISQEHGAYKNLVLKESRSSLTKFHNKKFSYH